MKRTKLLAPLIAFSAFASAAGAQTIDARPVMGSTSPIPRQRPIEAAL